MNSAALSKVGMRVSPVSIAIWSPDACPLAIDSIEPTIMIGDINFGAMGVVG